MTDGDFSEFFGTVKEKVLQSLPKNLPKLVHDRIANVLSYNVPGGKLNRGKSVYESYVILTGKKDNMEKMFILGWCVELVGNLC